MSKTAVEREWTERHESLAARLAHLGPQGIIANPVTNVLFCLYTAVFPDPQFRVKLETYILELNPTRTEFRPRKAAPHELSLQGLRETVVAAEQMIEKYARENPKVQLMYYLGVTNRT